MIDLTKLPAPTVVETLDFETILAEMGADFQARSPDFDALVESDPVTKAFESAGYREMLLRQRINDAARSLLLAFASAADLDQLAALVGVTRLLVDGGDPDAVPPVDPTYESDDRLRERVQLAPESQSTAGPEGAYRFHALSASALVLDVDVDSPAAVQIVVTVLSSVGDGTPDQELLDLVTAALADDRQVRPKTDQVTVQAAEIVNYNIDATLTLYDGPDAEVVRLAAEAAVTLYASDHHRLGHDITLSGLYAALHQPGVQKVTLNSALPAVIAGNQASWCTGIVVTVGGVDE